MKTVLKNEIDKLQSKIDSLHGECQYWQLIVLMYKYSRQKAIEICEPKRSGHYSKDQVRMSNHIDFLKENWDKEPDKSSVVYDCMKDKLKEKIKQLRETKKELYNTLKK